MTSAIRHEINIAIIGVVSAGKSTLTNALFVEQFSDMHIKRTTTLPQVYYETKDINLMGDLTTIRESNRDINTKMMEESIDKPLTLSDIKEVKYYVPRVFDLIDSLKDDVYLTVYDMPGLNDGITKNVYHDYTIKTFHNFDIIIFILDIHSGLNTSDETDILKLILKNMKLNADKYQIFNKLIILLNKCDAMECDESGINCEPLDDELIEMKNQVYGIVQSLKVELYPDANIDILCISCEDAYIYRMYKRNPKCELDPKYLNKFGANEFGKSRWNRLPDKKKKSEIVKLFKKYDYTENIKLAGFLAFKKSLDKSLQPDNQYKYLMNHINYEIYNFQITDITHIIQTNISFKNILNKITTLNEIFGKTSGYDKLAGVFDTYAESQLIQNFDIYKTELNADELYTFQKKCLAGYIALDETMTEIRSKTKLDTNINYIKNIIIHTKKNISDYNIKQLNDKNISLTVLTHIAYELMQNGNTDYNIGSSNKIENTYHLLCQLVTYTSFKQDTEILSFLKLYFKKLKLHEDQQIECIISNIMLKYRINQTAMYKKTENGIVYTVLTIKRMYEVTKLLNKYYFMRDFKYYDEINYIKLTNVDIYSGNYLDYNDFKSIKKDYNVPNKWELEHQLIRMIETYYPNSIHNMDTIIDKINKEPLKKLDETQQTLPEKKSTETIENKSPENLEKESPKPIKRVLTKKIRKKEIENKHHQSSSDSDDDIDLANEIDNELKSDSE
jgi:GTPase Era involved in 16S rRNA processing